MDQVLIVFVKYSNATSYRLARRRQSRHEDMQTERRAEGLRESWRLLSHHHQLVFISVIFQFMILK